MFSYLSSILAIIKDVKEEVKEKNHKYIFVSSEEELLHKLKKLNVDPSEVQFLDTKEPVKDWSKVAGVFKVNNKIYAYSETIKSELSAALSAI